MGEVEVMVGCPHKLRRPITSHTRYPCEVCAVFGSPGWPRWAIAMTVDYGPRLSRAAVEGAEAVPVTPPLPPALKPLGDAVRTIADRIADLVAHPTLAQRVRIEHGPINVAMQSQSDGDRLANVTRFEATQAMRLRRR